MDQIVFFGIGGLAVIVACAIALMVRSVAPRSFPRVLVVIVVLMAVQCVAAASGLLREWKHTPPPIVPLLGVTLALTIWLAFSHIGTAMSRQLPVSLLIGYQVFRLPLELVLHRAASLGIMATQMSWSGYNFDVLSGALALPVAWIASRSGRNRWIVAAWNVVGSVLLVVIIAIAVLSTPLVAAFGPDRFNTFIADPPSIWLPGVLVPSALLGHLLLWRALLAKTA
jgi:hypothetical protein